MMTVEPTTGVRLEGPPLQTPTEGVERVILPPARRSAFDYIAIGLLLVAAVAAIVYAAVQGPAVTEVHDSWMNVPVSFVAPAASFVEVHDSWMNLPPPVEVHDSWMTVSLVEVHDSWMNLPPALMPLRPWEVHDSWMTTA